MAWTGFRTGSKTEAGAARAARFVAMARAALVWERLWPALWPATGVAALFFAAAFADLFRDLPRAVHLLILAGAAIALLAAIYAGFRNWRWPGAGEAARKVERDSALANRPLSERGDAIAAGAGDAVSEAFWHVHRLRLSAAAKRLRVVLPAPGLPSRDPYALRFLVLVVFAAAAATAGDAWRSRLANAFTPRAGENGAFAVALDAWIAPPEYTGRPPLYLLRAGDAGGDTAIAAPAGSRLVLRVHGASGIPLLRLDPEPEAGTPDFREVQGSYEAVQILAGDTRARVRADGRTLGDWNIRVTPDLPPEIALSGTPGATTRDALRIDFTASDDYGVTAAEARIRLSDAAPGTGESLVLPLPLPNRAGTKAGLSLFTDQTAHPFAGQRVVIQLVATDAAGQAGVSDPAEFTMPARTFFNPLARALVEQRRELARDDADARERAALVLDALAIAPERFYAGEPSVYLGLRAAYWRLSMARDAADLADVRDLLWDLALAIEDGEAPMALRELRRLQQALMEALARGASDEDITQLMAQLRAALDQYLRSLAENAPEDAGPMPPGAQMLSSQDLDQLLDAIEDLARTGARGSAQALLSQLQSMLENLGVAGGRSQSAAGEALDETIRSLSELMGAQRLLLDRTFREQMGAGPDNSRPLAEEQGNLRERLEGLAEGLSGKGIEAPQSLGGAGRAMDEAERNLAGRRLGPAGEAQKEALDRMREAAQDLVREALRQMGEEDSDNGEGGTRGSGVQVRRGDGSGMGRNGRGPRDPLGRPLGQDGMGFGSDVRVPEAGELQRAKEILSELRRRAAERGRPQIELDYIDRLLKQF